MLRILSLTVLVLLSSMYEANTNNSVYSKASIYYYDWDVRTRSRLTINDVRENYSAKFEIQDYHEASLFILSLPINNFKTVDKIIDSNTKDVRLVIDLFKENGEVDTFYADRFTFSSLDGTKTIGISDNFRESFKLRVKSDNEQ